MDCGQPVFQAIRAFVKGHGDRHAEFVGDLLNLAVVASIGPDHDAGAFARAFFDEIAIAHEIGD